MTSSLIPTATQSPISGQKTQTKSSPAIATSDSEFGAQCQHDVLQCDAPAGNVCRFVIITVLAIAGALAAKRSVPRSAGTLPTEGGLFISFLCAVILIVGGHTYFPVIVFGPVAEHLAMQASTPF